MAIQWDRFRQQVRRDAGQVRSEAPERALLSLTRNQLNQANRLLDDNGFGGPPFDQYPGKREPRIFSLWYGPIGLVTARRKGATGHEAFATVASPSAFILPRNVNLLTGREFTFWWEGTLTTSYLSWTYLADPGYQFNTPIAGKAAGSIWDSVLDKNGGAQLMQCNSAFMFRNTLTTVAQREQPRICFDFELYDKRRGRSLTEGVVPGELFMGGGYGPKRFEQPRRLDPDTELEPRMYVREVRMTAELNADAAYNQASVAAWVNLMFTGYTVSEVAA